MVNEYVILVNMMSNEVFDIVGVIVKFGVLFECIVDYLSFIGDIVDNVFGVEKCGFKIVVKWFFVYGLFDGVMVNVDKIIGVVGENLCCVLDWLL